MTREESIHEGYKEVVPFTTKKVEVKVEDDEDGYGTFVRVAWNNTISSKYYYK